MDQGKHGERAKPSSEVSRRDFLKGASLTVATVGIVGTATAVPTGQESQTGVPVVGPGKLELRFNINGKSLAHATEPSMTLLDMVRNELDLTGAKRSCDRGSCGACTMIVDGRPINSCSMLAIDAAGKEITTIEGLAVGDTLSPIQEAFVECDALQCGFCTPGMVVACSAFLKQNPSPTRAEIAEGIAGNICRCGTYQNIFEAVLLAAKKGRRRHARF